MARQRIPRFEIDPTVVYQLGDSLITDAVQALIELVKNSYDADANYAKVTVDTREQSDVNSSFYPPSGGRIVVEDDGFGMDWQDIEFGWLTVSSRRKRDFKLGRMMTPRGRIPLGDKGLGRLGVQRLGKHLEIFTKAKDQPGHHIGFTWAEFATAKTLADVKIKYEEVTFPAEHGTKVVVSDLHEIDLWRGKGGTRKLEQELSQLISPFKIIRDFFVAVSVDGKSLELLEVSEKIREIAPIRYSLKFDGHRFEIDGKVRLDFFRPASRREAEEFALFAEADDGKAFYKFLASQKQKKDFGLVRSRSKRWFVTMHFDRDLESIDKVARIGQENGKIADPGPFVGEVDSFDLGSGAFRNQSVFDRISEFRRYIKELSGIRVYRDGFAIRVGHDWLKLGAQWTSAKSYFGLKPDNTLGYIALTAGDNPDLEETTDREGFKDTPNFRNFYALLSEFVRFTVDAQSFLGRTWAAFRELRHEESAQIESDGSIEELIDLLKDQSGNASSHMQALLSAGDGLESALKTTSSVYSRVAEADGITAELGRELDASIHTLDTLAADTQKTIDSTAAYLEQIERLQELSQVLEDRVHGLRRQTEDMYEAVALGLTAEALSHEVFNVADALAEQTKSARSRLGQLRIRDRSLTAFIEYVNSAVIALRKQMSFLSPALRYVREEKHDIDIGSFLKGVVEFYEEKLARDQIRVEIKGLRKGNFDIRMNRGKLTQVLDNLLQNAHYWLNEEITQGRLTSGLVTIEVHRPFVRVLDNGRGIDPGVENRLFEPFVSAKAKGRGLGLFIVRQLLESEGCFIGILPGRNNQEHLFKFQIDFRGAMND